MSLASLILLGGPGDERGFNSSRLGERLYQGSLPPEGLGVRTMGFDVLVLCARQYQDGRYEGIDVVKCPLDDSKLTEPEWYRAVRAAQTIVPLIRQGKKVLVTCRMGINRSGLVSALTLHMLTGWPGAKCVTYIQTARPGALQNKSFIDALTQRIP